MKKNILMLMLVIVFFSSGCVIESAQAPQTSPVTETESITDNQSSTAEPNAVSDYDISKVNDYMRSIEEQSDIIKTSLEQDALTQSDMNLKSQELYELWDNALNYLWGELKCILPEEEFVKLQDEQLVWITEKEAAQKEAGSEVEGGSLYPLVVNGKGAAITEERVYEFYEILKQIV